MVGSCIGKIVATLAILVAGSVPSVGEQSSECSLGTLGFAEIRILFPTNTRLPVERPTVICFQLSISELGSLRDALARGPVEVSAFDQEGRQLLSRGTLFVIENATNQGNIRLGARFH